MSEARDDRARPDRRPGRRPRPRRHRRQRPRGDAAAHRGVPQPRLSRSPPTRRSSWPRMDGAEIRQLDRRRGLPVHQRVRGRAHRAEDRLERATRSLERVGTRVTTLGARTAPVERKGEDADRGAGAPARCARPTRPASATRSGPASSPGSPGGSATSGAPQVGSMLATYVIETVGTQEYELGRARLPRPAWPRPTATRRPPRSSRTSPARAPRTGARGDRRSSPRASPWRVDPRPGRRPARTSSGSVPTSSRAPSLAAYRAGLFPMGLGARRRPPLGLVVAGPARRAAAGRAAGQPLAARGPAAASRCGSTPPSTRSSPRCADPRRDGRWITAEVADAYAELHALGWAHSRRDLAGRRAGRWPLRRWRSAACSPGSRCSTARRDASKVAAGRARRAARRRRRPAPAASTCSGAPPHLAQPGRRASVPREDYLERLADGRCTLPPGRAVGAEPARSARGAERAPR